MREIQIKSTDRTPSITFNPTTGYICIAGKAIPENAIQYFRPIVDGIGEFVKDPTPEVTVDIKLELSIRPHSISYWSFLKGLKVRLVKDEVRLLCDGTVMKMIMT